MYELLKLKTDKQNGVYMDAQQYNKHIERMHQIHKIQQSSTLHDLLVFIRKHEALLEDVTNANLQEVLQEGTLKLEDILYLLNYLKQ